MPEVLKWGDPPPRVGRSKWAPVRAELRDHPGEWGCIEEAIDARRAQSVVQTLSKENPDIEAYYAEAGGTFQVWARAVMPERVIKLDENGGVISDEEWEGQ